MQLKMLSITRIQILLVLTVTLFILEVSCGTSKRNRDRDNDEDDDSSASSSTESQTPGGIGVFPDYSKRLEGLHASVNDPIPSSQNISPAIAGYSNYNNPFLLNGQANLQNNPALLYQNGGVGLGIQNPLAAGAGGLGGLGVGGLNNLNFQGQGQSPYNLAAIQSLLLQQQQQQQGGIGGIGGLGGLGGFGSGLYNSDPYSQQSVGVGVGGLYNQYNPLLGGGLAGAGVGVSSGYLGGSNFGALGVGAGVGGINPYLLGQRGSVLGQNYLAQSLLSPYNSYNQINPYSSYPFSARFGIGRGSSSSSSGRISSSSNSNNDE